MLVGLVMAYVLQAVAVFDVVEPLIFEAYRASGSEAPCYRLGKFRKVILRSAR